VGILPDQSQGSLDRANAEETRWVDLNGEIDRCRVVDDG
jgi:hypothetical protein